MPSNRDRIDVIRRGGEQLALYLQDDEFTSSSGQLVIVAKSDVTSASAGMADVIARHKARYGLVSLFCRPGRRVLDFPCGSGYGAERLRDFDIRYEGIDIDAPTIEYARRQYGRDNVSFRTGDLCAPDIVRGEYDVAACIEGLEHIERDYQLPLINALYRCLKSGGTMVISSPEAIGPSGPSTSNPEHKCELSRQDFTDLLINVFGKQNVEIISQRGIVLSTGVKTTCLYGVCHRE